MSLFYTITHSDKNARTGILELRNGRVIQTPVFMPVGTQATVKALSSQDLKDLQVEMILANAYHLYLRPGAELVASAGGLHDFMNWSGGIITDSGGFQVFSLSDLRKISAAGVEFTSHLDGSRHFFTPESNMRLQHQLGADIMMALDVCVAYPSSREEIERSVALTSAWARDCQEIHASLGGDQNLFGIIQGGVFAEARKKSAQDLMQMDFPGYGIGGLSVGEGPQLMNEILDVLNPVLPYEKPRYLMGVGTPEDLWNAIERGVDMFDCAMPTRIARNGTLYTSQGRLVVKNAKYAKDFSAPDPTCHCPLCANHSRAYLRHLFNTREISALRLSTLHNLSFMLNLTGLIRNAIKSGCFQEARQAFMAKYRTGDSPE
ncbi:tRNA guanosine(34) transglycosylase Tgt [bacterium]|nr:tRNA guanosine(34) transglycosylase Tgt [bacterium]